MSDDRASDSADTSKPNSSGDDGAIDDGPEPTADGHDAVDGRDSPGRGGSSSRTGVSPSRPERPPLGRSIAARLRDDPILWLPFLAAGCLHFVADLFRKRDPLPSASGIEESTIHVAYSIFPTGTTATQRPLGALVDLQRPSLAYALGLEILAVVAIAVAGWLTMLRASDEPNRPVRFLAYVTGVFLVDLLFRSADAIGLEYAGGSLLIGLAVLAVAVFIFVRLFLVPVAMLREGGIAGPIGSSWRYSRGHGLALVGTIVVIGVGSWALAFVPTVGTVLSTTIAGTVHAVSLVALYERCAGETVLPTGPADRSAFGR